MKTMTCAQMGGPCDAPITGATEQEMIDNGMAHVNAAHPEMVADMSNMTQEQKDAWNADFKAKWDAQSEDATDEAPEVAAEETPAEEEAAA